MKMNDMFPSKYLKAEDFGEGERRTLTIKNIELEELGKGEKRETKPIVYFKDSEKGLVLNKTNGSVIAEVYGQDTDLWIGKPITLFTMEVDSFGDIVRAIRVSKTVAVENRDDLMNQLKALREELKSKGGTLPDKKTLLLTTNDEIKKAIQHHTGLLAELEMA